MFHRLAAYYDDLVGGKDYALEARHLEALAGRLRRSTGRRWLDVACGTGRHLSYLRRHFEVRGIDRSPEMLRVARRRLPGVRLEVGDMRTFRLNAEFDVVSCLFSAIGHLRSERELGATFANFQRHLKPGGIVIVEPWIDPADFRPGFVHAMARESPSASVVRMAFSSRQGRRSLVHFHYLIGAPGRRVQHFEEVDLGLLVPRARLCALMRRAGLTARFLRKGLPSGRGLLVGRKRYAPRAAGRAGQRSFRRSRPVNRPASRRSGIRKRRAV
ncbi:MAG TPA: class I SAM-dependent methyltransferase [Thermoplasmata archaeon]|nr:class I SAM-dependent methyltransferase [Thermoplasmata archaeon]